MFSGYAKEVLVANTKNTDRGTCCNQMYYKGIARWINKYMYLEYNHSFIILRYLNIKYILNIRIIFIYLNPYGFRANDPLTWS